VMANVCNPSYWGDGCKSIPSLRAAKT
jgi:hypothetical protein